MKKFLATALLFASAFAFAEGYEDWFTPPNKWEGVKAPVKLVLNVQGSPTTIDFSVNIDFSLDDMLFVIDDATAGLPETAKNAFKMSRLALANSLYASCQAHMNKLKIDNLGAALEGVFVSTYGQYVDEQGNVLSKSKSGVDTAKVRQQLLANKNAVVSGGQAAGGSEQNPLTVVVTQKPYDERQFEQHVENGRSLTSLNEWYGLSDSKTDGLDGARGWALNYEQYFIPYTTGQSDTLGWMKWNGLEAGCLSAGNDVQGGNNDKPLRLFGWTTADNCTHSIQSLLTNESEIATTDRSRHKILTRYDDGNGAVIHWTPFDTSAMSVGGEGHADDKSIELTKDEGASSEDPKKFRLKGFAAAKPAQAKDGAVLPFVDATSDDLQWAGIENFFADSVFRKSSTTGKILLNGTSEEGKVKVLAITGSGGDDQTVSSLTFDNKSIDGNPSAGGIVQLHDFATAPSPYVGNVSFADALTNTTTEITGMSIPVRYPSSAGPAVAYVPMGKITGIPAAAVDNKTIEVNESDPQNKFLQLHGAAGEGITLNDGDVYQIGSDGKGKFAKLGAEEDDAEVSAENASIESYTGTDGGKYLRLKGWTETKRDIPHILGWSNGALSYWLADGANGVAVKDTDEGEKIMLDNYDTAAVGAMPYKTSSGLGWMAGAENRVPLLHGNGAPSSMAIGASLDKNNISAVPTLNVSGFTSGGGCSAKLNTMLSDPADSANRNAHQFMARYSNGGDATVHWVGIDDIISAGERVDDRSITTNYSNGAYEDGIASLWGFRFAADGDTPTKQGDALVWRPSLEVDGMTLTNVNGKVSIIGWENVPSNQVLYAEWDEDNNTNHLRWVELDLNRCHCPNHCPIHDVDYVDGFCPEEGCPHSKGGMGISSGDYGGGNLDNI